MDKQLKIFSGRSNPILAKKIAEEQLKVTHPKFNIEVSNVKGKTNGN